MALIFAFATIVLLTTVFGTHEYHGLGTRESDIQFFTAVMLLSLGFASVTLLPGILHFWHKKK